MPVLMDLLVTTTITENGKIHTPEIFHIILMLATTTQSTCSLKMSLQTLPLKVLPRMESQTVTSSSLRNKQRNCQRKSLLPIWDIPVTNKTNSWLNTSMTPGIIMTSMMREPWIACGSQHWWELSASQSRILIFNEITPVMINYHFEIQQPIIRYDGNWTYWSTYSDNKYI